MDRREEVALLLRQFMANEIPDLDTVLDLMARYGELDGELICFYAAAFAQVGQSLSVAQQAALTGMRTDLLGELSYPDGACLYAKPIEMPEIEDTDFLFK